VKRLKIVIGVIFLSFLAVAIVTEAQAGIMLKLIAVNPSKTQAQKIQIKEYLPKETKDEHIISKADLEIAYDTQQGSFFVYGEYLLQPGEVMEKEIEIRDIWVIDEVTITEIQEEATKLMTMLKNTEYASRIEYLKNNIDSKLNQIIENQKNPPPNPEQHISQYRDDLKILQSIKADLALGRNFLAQVKPLSTDVLWKLVIGIVLFLGLLGGSFYLIWNKQLKTITQDDTFFIPKEDQPAEPQPGTEQQGEDGEKKTEQSKTDETVKDEPKEEA